MYADTCIISIWMKGCSVITGAHRKSDWSGPFDTSSKHWLLSVSTLLAKRAVEKGCMQPNM